MITHGHEASKGFLGASIFKKRGKRQVTTGTFLWEGLSRSSSVIVRRVELGTPERPFEVVPSFCLAVFLSLHQLPPDLGFLDVPKGLPLVLCRRGRAGRRGQKACIQEIHQGNSWVADCSLMVSDPFPPSDHANCEWGAVPFSSNSDKERERSPG